MIVIAIDPGSAESAWVHWSPFNRKILLAKKLPNRDLLMLLRNGLDPWLYDAPHCTTGLYIEMVASYGMPVGKEVFETVLWIGRFQEAWDERNSPSELIYRRDVKLHHCGSMRAKDGNVRQVLIDKYGAPGKKKEPGLTYGLSGDLWQAFAIATFVTEKDQP